MVRINLISPSLLTDQHLIAEFNEILMAIGYYRKHPEMDGTEPKEYKLGKGHIKFFRDKFIYLIGRHEQLRIEMFTRGYEPKVNIDPFCLPLILHNDWTPTLKDKLILIARLHEKIMMKPNYYTLYHKPINAHEYIEEVYRNVRTF